MRANRPNEQHAHKEWEIDRYKLTQVATELYKENQMTKHPTTSDRAVHYTE